MAKIKKGDRIKLLNPYCSPKGTFPASTSKKPSVLTVGDVVDDKEAAQLVEGGFAVLLDETADLLEADPKKPAGKSKLVADKAGQKSGDADAIQRIEERGKGK